MASRLKRISHSDDHKRFFRASGGELYTSLDDCLSSIDSPVLIAVDKGEQSSQRNGSDNLRDSVSYCIIIAMPTNDSDTSTIHTAEIESRDLLVQVRNVLVSRYGNRIPDYRFYPSGAIGDNFYGTVLEYSFESYPVFSVDSNYFYDELQGEES